MGVQTRPAPGECHQTHIVSCLLGKEMYAVACGGGGVAPHEHDGRDCAAVGGSSVSAVENAITGGKTKVARASVLPGMGVPFTPYNRQTTYGGTP
jgi:hypothetical protein